MKCPRCEYPYGYLKPIKPSYFNANFKINVVKIGGRFVHAIFHCPNCKYREERE